MDNKKATLTEFIKYLKNNRASGRLVNTLNCADGYMYDLESNERLEDIRVIPDISYTRLRNLGKKSLAELIEFRTSYFEYYNLEKIEETKKEIPREEFSCQLRSDVLKTLKTIENEEYFVEIALLEKFDRDQIKLVKE